MQIDDGDESEEQINISQWASNVLDFSGSYGSDSSISYSSNNICGRPSKYPLYGDFAECYSLRCYGPSTEVEISQKDQTDITFQEFICINYENYVLPTSVKIYETYNPGSIVKIFCYCPSVKKWEILWEESVPTVVEKKSREFCPPINKISSNYGPTKILRIEFNLSLSDYYIGIDGVLLSGIKCILPIEKPLMVKGVIQKKLETVQFKPQKTPSEAIEEFLKNDLKKFIDTIEHETSSKTVNEVSSDEESKIMSRKQISDVPVEVMFKIFSFLDLKSLYNCSLVCKTFRNLITNLPLLYVEVNLKFYWHLANSSLMSSLLDRCKLIRKLDLSSCGYFGQISPMDFVNFISSNGRTLTSLRLNSSQFLNTSCLEIISETCDNLTELSIRNYMDMTQERDFTSLSLLDKLKILDVSRSGIDSQSLLNILKNNPDLQYLNVAFSWPNISMDNICIQLSCFNKGIKSIDMWKCHNLSVIGLRALSECKSLEELNIGWCLREEPTISESLKILLMSCKNIKKLILAAIRAVTERDLEYIVSFCPLIETLDLMGINAVSEAMCLRILDSCRNLTLLDVSFCDNIDHDLLMRWRNQYTNTSIKRSEVPNEG